MPKDFVEFASSPEHQATGKLPSNVRDPNLFHNVAVINEIKEKFNMFTIFELAGKLATLCTLAPLVTMQVSLQLSVAPHKEKYHDTIQNEKRDIIKSPNPLTVQDKRRYEMVLKSGVTQGNMPFRAPVYSSYKEVFNGLLNQGVLGFYKGNFAGCLHIGSSFIFKRYLAIWFKFGKEERFWKKSKNWMKIFIATSLSTIADLIFYPMMTMQSRFILQNRLPNFSVYKGFAHFVVKHQKRVYQYYQGWTAIIPYNIILMLNTASFSRENIVKGLWIGHNLGSLFSYPLTTIMRRLQCQIELPGMIPLRYGGVWHCFKLMLKEEGVKGFYRGYPLHFMVTNAIFTVGMITYINFSKYFYLAKID